MSWASSASSLSRPSHALNEQPQRISPKETPTWVSNDESRDEIEEHLSGLKLSFLMVSLTLAVFLMLLDASIVATVIPKLTGEFHALEDIGWYGTSYLVANCALQPLSGKIYTYFNVKWTFLAFFGLFELGSALCGAAISSQMLIVGRAVAGMGASGLLNGGYTILAFVLLVAKQAKYRGILMGLSFFGLVAGPLIGGALTEFTTWRWCFYINLPCGAVIAGLLLLVPMPNYRIADDGTQTVLQALQKLDLVGFIIFTPCVIMLLLSLQWGGTTDYPWDSATIIGLFCGAFGSLLSFLAWERRAGSEAMIPLALVRRRIIWTSCLNMACFFGCSFTTSYYLPVYFQAVRGRSPFQSGVAMLPQIVTNMITTIIAGALVGRVGYYLPFALVSGMFTAVAAGLMTTLAPKSSTGKRVGYQILQGLQGLGFQVPILAVQHGVRKQDISIANALVVFFQNLSAAVFLSFAKVVFSHRLRHYLAMYAPGADMNALAAAGASAADIRGSVSPDLLLGVQLSYSKTFDDVMYLATGAACGAFLFSTGMGWVRIKTN